MMLADDVAFLSETVVGLQSQLNSLSRAASSLHLSVNLNKSDITVLRQGGYLGAREKWTYNEAIMRGVKACRYLRIFFCPKLSFRAACHNLNSRRKSALLHCLQKLYKFKNNWSIWCGESSLDSTSLQCEQINSFTIQRV